MIMNSNLQFSRHLNMFSLKHASTLTNYRSKHGRFRVKTGEREIYPKNGSLPEKTGGLECMCLASNLYLSHRGVCKQVIIQYIIDSY